LLNLSNNDKSGRDELSNLIGRAQEGNKQAFAKIYDILAKDVYKFILFRIGDEEMAKDLTSETFFKVWQKIDSFTLQKDAKFSTWVYQIAKFAVIDHYRVSGREISENKLSRQNNPIGEESWQLEARFDREKDKKRIISALAQLKDEYREILTLKFINSFENNEIAKILGKTEGNVRILQLRALKSLAKILKNNRDSGAAVASQNDGERRNNERKSQKTGKRIKVLRR